MVGLHKKATEADMEQLLAAADMGVEIIQDFPPPVVPAATSCLEDLSSPIRAVFDEMLAAPAPTCDFDDNPAAPGSKFCVTCRDQLTAVNGLPNNLHQAGGPGPDLDEKES